MPEVKNFSKRELDELGKLNHRELMQLFEDNCLVVQQIEDELGKKVIRETEIQLRERKRKHRIVDVDFVPYIRDKEPFAPEHFMEVRNLKLVQTRGKKSSTLIDNISFDAKSQSVLAILTPPETDYTPIISALLRNYKSNTRITDGEIWIKKSLTTALSRKDFRGAFQEMMLVADERTLLKMRGGIKIKDMLLASDIDRKLFAECLKKIGLENIEHYIGFSLRVLTGGNLIKMELARALASPKPFLVLQEPTREFERKDIAGLARAMRHSINDPVKKHSILLLTSDIDLVRYGADYCIVMDGAEVVERGTPQRVLTSPRSELTKLMISLYNESKE